MIDPIDFSELMQKLRIAIVKAHDFCELRAITGPRFAQFC
jgi:hypothetical protein